MELIEFELFYDYNCPFVYRASQLIEMVRDSAERDIKVSWRYFSLSQVNHRSEPPDDGWTVWGAADSESVRGRLAFKAAEAAVRQGGFEAFHPALLKARHHDRLDIDNRQVVDRVADESGLDLDRFRRDLEDPVILAPLARDHEAGRDRYGVFGTPTFVFPGGAAAYIRLANAPMNEDAVRVFDQIVAVTRNEPVLLEIKRPVPPSPD